MGRDYKYMIYMCISYILAFFVVNDDSPIEPPGLKERRKNGERRESAVGVGVVMSQGRGERQGRLIPQYLFVLSPPKHFYLQSDCSLFI